MANSDSEHAARKRLPRAMTKAPKEGSEYWVADPSDRDYFARFYWFGHDADNRFLERGLCYATRKDAKTVANAMLALVRP